MTKTKEISLCAVLTALALGLSYLERFIPLQLIVPLPGVKLGLANIVTLVALYMLRPRHALMILIPRCILGALFGGGITGLMFSLLGGLLAVGTMTLAGRMRLFSIYGVSILGAAAHNIGQILAAMILLKSVYIGAYLPWLLVVGVFTGLFTGFVTAGILRIIPNAIISVSRK